MVYIFGQEGGNTERFHAEKEDILLLGKERSLPLRRQPCPPPPFRDLPYWVSLTGKVRTLLGEVIAVELPASEHYQEGTDDRLPVTRYKRSFP